jgi:hypothetical protein
LGHVVPPQSTSDSLPLRVWSVHVGLWQIFELLQTELVQSPLPLHALPWPQRGQVGPPQSASDSPPFFTESEQVGARQTPLWQTPLTQSAPSSQP